jgi:hypothetical protein
VNFFPVVEDWFLFFDYNLLFLVKVTRCPLVWHLHKEDTSFIEWGEFSHLSDKKRIENRFKDFDKIQAEIERRTVKEAGQGKMVSKEPIFLTIYSPKVLCYSGCFAWAD